MAIVDERVWWAFPRRRSRERGGGAQERQKKGVGRGALSGLEGGFWNRNAKEGLCLLFCKERVHAWLVGSWEGVCDRMYQYIRRINSACK